MLQGGFRRLPQDLLQPDERVAGFVVRPPTAE